METTLTKANVLLRHAVMNSFGRAAKAQRTDRPQPSSGWLRICGMARSAFRNRQWSCLPAWMDDNSNCLKARKTQGDKNGVPDSCTPCGFESVWAVPNKAKF